MSVCRLLIVGISGRRVIGRSVSRSVGRLDQYVCRSWSVVVRSVGRLGRWAGRSVGRSIGRSSMSVGTLVGISGRRLICKSVSRSVESVGRSIRSMCMAIGRPVGIQDSRSVDRSARRQFGGSVCLSVD